MADKGVLCNELPACSGSCHDGFGGGVLGQHGVLTQEGPMTGPFLSWRSVAYAKNAVDQVIRGVLGLVEELPYSSTWLQVTLEPMSWHR